MIAVVPAAGRGKRMASVTNGAAKELLEVAGRPVLAWVVEECFTAGVEEVRIVGSPLKPAVAKFVKERGDSRLVYREQPEPIGLADAVAWGVESGVPTLVPMADSIFVPKAPSTKLRGMVEEGAWAAIAVHEVELELVSLYGIAAFDADGRIREVVEKPPPESSPSRWAIASRFAFGAAATSLLFEKKGHPEANLTDVLRAGLEAREFLVATPLEDGTRLFDCGMPEGFAAATAALGSRVGIS